MVRYWLRAGSVLAASVAFIGIVHAQGLPVINRPTAPSAPAASPAPPPIMHGRAQAARSSDGHFYFNATLNNTPVHMLVDTGASVIVLRSDDAVKAGLNPESLTYSIPSSTANGVTFGARAKVATMIIGGITQHDVPVMVSKPGALNVSLLGQSFLSQLTGFKINGNDLVLQAE